MAAKAAVPFLVGMMLLTGVCNTILTKYQDQQCVRDDCSKTASYFNQPVLQTLQMFIGESGCFLVLALMRLYGRYIKKKRAAAGGGDYEPISTIDREAMEDGETDNTTETTTTTTNTKTNTRTVLPELDMLKGRKVLLVALPAIADICGTTLMNAGLLMVAPSIYQMTRGALVLFVGLMSVIFLHRRLPLVHWLSLFGVVLGVAVVGLAGYITPDNGKAKATLTGAATKVIVESTDLVRRAFAASNKVHSQDQAADDAAKALAAVMGVLLIAGAQIFTATQFVLEEYFMERSNIEPLQMVAWEGVFGGTTTIVLMLLMHLIVGRTEAGQGGIFDMVEGFREMTQYRTVLVSSFLIMISIGGFNYFGLAVTRSVSATARSTIDTCRTLFIWIVSLGLGWESFKWLQVLGFAMLVYFTMLFNDVIRPPIKALRVPEEEEGRLLLPEEPVEHN